MVLLLLGCISPSGRYDAVRGECGLAVGEYAGLHTVGRTEISETCATALGDSVGVDWVSMGEPASWTEPSTVGQMFVSGLYSIIATDMGSIDALESRLSTGELFEADLADARADWSLDGTMPAGQFWFGWLTERVDVVQLRAPEGAGRMRYLGGVVNVYVTWPIAEESAYEQIFASITVHEASHYTAPDHLVTGAFQYDADASGAYGAGARWLYEWMEHELDVTHPDCPALVEELSDACEQIADWEGFAPCLEPFACEGAAAD